MTGDAAQVLEAVAQDQSGLRRQVNIALGGTPEPLSGASALIAIRVAFTYDPRYCYCNTVPVTYVPAVLRVPYQIVKMLLGLVGVVSIFFTDSLIVGTE